MLSRRDYALIVGLSLCCFGLFCLPMGTGASAKRDLSLFNRLADLGAFVSVGLVLLAAGLLVVVITLLLPVFCAVFHRLTRRPGERLRVTALRRR